MATQRSDKPHHDVDRYTHGHDEAVLRSHTWRNAENSCAYLLPYLNVTERVLDVGCGPGTITADLAAYLPQGRVLGLDASTDVVARARLSGEKVGRDNLAFAVGDAYSPSEADLQFLGGAPTVVHAHQLLQHLGDPVRALRAMASVVSPQGLVAVRDADYSAMSWYPQLPELDRWREVYMGVARRNGGEPDAGRRLLRWVRLAGLKALDAGASTWCFNTPDLRAWWGNSWADRMTDSQVGRQAVEYGLCTRADLENIAEGWRSWVGSEDGWFVVVHGEVLIRVA